jgi:predicted PurR-regulated permease PerM
MPTLTTRKIITGVLVVLAVFIAFALLDLFLNELILVFTGIVISISMAPAVEWLRRCKLPRPLSMLLIYLCLAIFFVGFIFLIIPQTIQQSTILAPRFDALYTVLRSNLQSSPYLLIRQLFSSLPGSLSLFFIPVTPHTSGAALNSFNWSLNKAESILGGLFTLTVVLIMGFYWTIEGERVEYTFSLFFPVEKRENTREIIRDIETRVGGFVRGQLLLALAVAGMALAAYLCIGLPSVLSLAFLAGLFELVPYFGPALGALPALLVAFAYDPGRLVWVIVAVFAIQLLENHFLAPRIMQKTVGVNPIVTILSITGFGILLGFSGLLMAIPLAAVFQVILDRALLQQVESKIKAPAGRDRLSQLSYEAQEFVQDIHKLIRRKESTSADGDNDEIEDAIEEIAADLDDLLAQSVQPENLP